MSSTSFTLFQVVLTSFNWTPLVQGYCRAFMKFWTANNQSASDMDGLKVGMEGTACC